MAKKLTGTVSQVIGPVIDVHFPDGRLPAINNALTVPIGNKTLTVEVAQHIGGNTERRIGRQPRITVGPAALQRQRQFDRAEIGRQMAARLRHAVEHERAQLVGERLQLATIEAAQVRGVVDGFQQVVHRRSIVGNRALPHFCPRMT